MFHLSDSNRATPQSREDLFRVERWSDAPEGEEAACADCGTYGNLIGPFDHDGNVAKGADMVCSGCAETRGADLTYCTCGTSSPREITCPGCRDYLGGGSLVE